MLDHRRVYLPQSLGNILLKMISLHSEKDVSSSQVSCFPAGKKVTVRAPAPALASLTKPKHQSPQSILRNIQKGLGVSRGKKATCVSSRGSGGPVQERPLRERLTHLLALRPYKRPELILRLKKDGLSAEDKDMLESVVMEVSLINKCIFYLSWLSGSCLHVANILAHF